MEANGKPALKVVTIDDSILVAERIQYLLSDLNYIHFAGNARNIATALDLVLHAKPDVVILDIHLEEADPTLNGITLLNIFRKQHIKMKIIMLTNFPGALYRKTCLALGADHFFDKSNDIDELLETLATIQSSPNP